MVRPKSKRRWLQFSLRTLMLLVAVLALWLGYHVNWLQARRHYYNVSPYSRDFDPGTSIVGPGWTRNRPSAPWGLRVFGEEGVNFVTIDPDMPAERRAADSRKMKALFPEAEVQYASDEILERWYAMREDVGKLPPLCP